MIATQGNGGDYSQQQHHQQQHHQQQQHYDGSSTRRRITATQAATNHVEYYKATLTLAEADFILFQSLVVQDKQHHLLGTKRPNYSYDEKQLREAAAAEVALSSQFPGDENDKSSRKRKQLSVDEKAQQNRDRNREHAKNTRLRKKAYVTKLKELMDQVTRQKDKDDKDRKKVGEKIYEETVIRKHILRTMLSYRAENCQDRATWSSILDDSVMFSIPVTPYRSFHKNDVVTNNRVLNGIEAVMKDVASFAVLVESIGQGSNAWMDAIKHGEGGQVLIHVEPQEILAAGDYVMICYYMEMIGVGMNDSINKCIQHGMIRCQFNEENKIIAVEMVFDVMAFLQQIQRATIIQPATNILPNTLAVALQASKEARCIVKAEIPSPVIHVNDAWTKLNGYSQFDTEGKSLFEILEVVDSQQEHFYAMLAECADGFPTSSVLVKKGHELSLFYLKLSPLTSEGDQISHILVVQVAVTVTATEQAILKEALRTNDKMGSFAFNKT